MAKKHTRMSEALAHLKQLIELGCEFPDAVYQTSVAFEMDTLSVEILEANYDLECMGFHAEV
jgi:hypothetical protein